MSDLGDSRAYRILENRFHTRSLNYVNRLKPLGFGYDLSSSETVAILLNDPYTTIRKSREAWKSWYDSYNIDEIRKIEMVCSKTMQELGYNKIYKKKNLNDDFRTYLLRNVCPNDLFLYCADDSLSIFVWPYDFSFVIFLIFFYEIHSFSIICCKYLEEVCRRAYFH